MSVLRNRWLHRLLGLALGALFIYASHDKIIDPRTFVTIIWGYRLLPPGPINLLALYLPWVEVVAGLALISGFRRRAAALLATGMLLMFTGALAINAVRGINVACGCFSTSAQDVHNAWLLVLRDLPMLIAALVLWLAPPTPQTEAVKATADHS